MSPTYAALVLALVFLCARSSHQQKQIPEPEKLVSQNPCVSKQTCSECIQTPTCAWCSQPNYGNGTSIKRCFQPNRNTKLGSLQCRSEYIINPDNVYTVLQSKRLTKAHGSYEAVQITPQRVSLKLRINEAYRISVDYAQAEDYPVDLYYLMDLSKSMEDDKDKLSDLGIQLAETMKNITSNFKLGFGSFVDKVVMPYVSTVPKKLKEPCDECAAPYGFQNHMSLDVNTERFAGEVKKASVSGNLDAPEGGFDAIMQAIVCDEQIGWRQKARRLLVYSTDAGFHYAGDGKLGGIVQPNDGECHMDSGGRYTHSSLQDYPSISQINLKVKKHAINVIFAVTASQLNIYEKLKDNVEGASAGQLSEDSSNVVTLIRDEYNKISSSVEMKDNATSAVKVTYYSNCLSAGPLKQTNKCDGLRVGTKVQFIAEIEVASCPKNRAEWNQILKISPVGINESLIVDLELQCDCPCENPGNPGFKLRAKECNMFGTYKCGICDCDSSHFGRQCECDSNNTHGSKDLTSGCRPDNITKVDCSNRGTCVCGQCECETRENPEEQITGPYCECDNFSCDRHNRLLCAGPDHGTCVCGQCVCQAGWTGKACECRASNDTCIPPGGGDICSNKGECVCGVCKCREDEDKGRYSGRYCEKCPTCRGRCDEFKACVQCQMYKTGEFDEEQCIQNCTFIATPVDVVEANEEKYEHLCAFYDEDDCRFAYVYWYDEMGKVLVRAQEKRECPPQIYILGIVLGVIGAIVLIGLAVLLLWKLLTTIHDRREFAKFENERQMAKWDTGENPIYKQATSTFKNPTYAGK